MSLVEDAISARKAHMTYGQWKMKQPVVIPPRKEQPLLLDRPWYQESPRIKFCAHCGRQFKGHNTKYCSRKCYLAEKKGGVGDA